MENCRKNKSKARQSYSVPGPSGCRAQVTASRGRGFSVNSEQLLIFFLAIWFFYFFYLQD